MICKRPTVPQKKKNERERRKHLQPKKYEVFKKKEPAHIKEYRFSVLQLQVSTATPTSETTRVKSSVFSTKQSLSRRFHKTERSLPSSPQKKNEMTGTLPPKKSIYA